MVFLTFIIIVSAFLRMYLYEQAYGYTLLRLLVYVTLFTEVVLLIPTVKYIINPETKITRDYIIIIVFIYTFINLINIDSVIAKKNIERYYETTKIDLMYLESYSTDNIPDLINLYKNSNDKELKYELKEYFKNVDTSITCFQEYNLSKIKARDLIKEMNY